MYKKTLFFIICFLVFTSIKAQETNNNYFEGEVYFKITSKSLNNRIPQEFLELETGNQMIGKVKRNKYLIYQNSAGELGATKMIFLLEEGLGYIEYENSDTITQISIEKNKDKLISKNFNNENTRIILGDTCNSVDFKFIPTPNYGIIEYVEAKYYFNPKYKLDEKLYKKHERNFWNKFVEMSNGGISVRNEIITYPLYSTVYEAIEIVEKEIPDKEFEIDKTKIIKKED